MAENVAAEALRQLAATSADLRRAVDLTNFAAAVALLTCRETQLQALQSAISGLDPQQLQQLDRVRREGEAAARSLLAYRETARTQIAELEAERLQLAALAPVRSSPTHLDLDA